MKQNLSILSGAAPTQQAFDALKARAFAYSSVAPRAAEVLRACVGTIPGAVVTARSGNDLRGYVALAPVHVRFSHGTEDLVLLGPLMVDPDVQGTGLGGALMETVLAIAAKNALPPILLVGDEGYYQRFGFVSGVASAWQMPGLAAPSRMLVKASNPLALPRLGAVLPAFAPPCEKQAAA